MLKVGDRVRYTGAYRDPYKFQPEYSSATDWVIVVAPSGRPRENSVMYMSGKTGQHVAVYAGDLELAGPAEPEEYEKWFV